MEIGQERSMVLLVGEIFYNVWKKNQKRIVNQKDEFEVQEMMALYRDIYI